VRRPSVRPLFVYPSAGVAGSRPPAATSAPRRLSPFARHRRTSSHIVAHRRSSRRSPVVSPSFPPLLRSPCVLRLSARFRRNADSTVRASTGAPTTVRGRFLGWSWCVLLSSARKRGNAARHAVAPAIRDQQTACGTDVQTLQTPSACRRRL